MSRTCLIAVGVGLFIALPGAADEIATLPTSEDPNIRIGVFRATVPISWRNAKDEIEAQQKELDRFANPILRKWYRTVCGKEFLRKNEC